MSNDEAKFILGAYRANGRDADNALFAEALRQARIDPALGAWWVRAQAHDAAVGGKVRAITPPPGLREAILAGGRASRSPLVRWQTPTWMALAAAAAIVLATGVVGLRATRAQAESTRFESFAVDDTAHAQHGSHGDAAGELATRLSSPSTKVGAELPVEFATLKATGCRTVTFAGHDVLEVCFKRDGQWFHCYIANRADFPRMTAGVHTDSKEQGHLASAAWSDATHHFVIVAEGGLAAVQRLL
jgi:hypothetical protein